MWAALVMLLLISVAPCVGAKNRGDGIMREALRAFNETDWSVPPPGIGVDRYRAVVASLPADGRLEPEDGDEDKLGGLRVLTGDGKRAPVEVVVADLPCACIYLYARAALIISGHALKLLSPEELLASVAHELGHEYYWSEYYAARERNDWRTLQKLEFLADGFAVWLLMRTGSDPESLLKGVQKLMRFNLGHGQTAADSRNYPSFKARTRFSEAVVNLIQERRDKCGFGCDEKVIPRIAGGR